ncbi:hypothetical protein BGZ99_010299 [Dissophora globulifera]|uniref:K Homology domain-containing protein n=1 Tax=Dissophora globulifera TaxID=979702 RepID=A0A9P6UYH9_9FUNG|nr:hypothetical protein BGZ99_010299 [Dissophora globulifera]
MHPDTALHSSDGPTSAAAKMQMLHQAQAQDESAVASAAAAATAAAAAAATAAAAAALTDDEPLTEPVAIKQAAPRKAQSLDLDSISMFPSLGSSSTRPAATTSTWGAGPSSRVKSAAGSKLGAVGDQRRSPAAALAAASATRVSSSGNVQERMQIPAVQTPAFGKATVGDIVKNVMTSSGARIESTTSQATGLTTFLISGKPEAVAKARLHLRSSFAKKETVKYPVPSSARAHLLGVKGRTLNSIQSKTGVTITVPPRDPQETTFEPANTNEDDLDVEEAMVLIDIEGDAESIKAAKEEVDNIVSKACRITYRYTTIPPTYYPFLSGSVVQSIQQETNTRINIPSHVSAHDDDEDEDAKDVAIVIQGDRKAIRKSLKLLDDKHQEIVLNTRTMTINIPKRQHRFLIGTKGVHIKEIHDTTGCTIEIPPVDSSSDSIIVRGPESKLIPALTLIMEKANSSQVETVDVAAAHKPVAGRSKTEHARRVTKYLSGRNKLRKIEQELEDVQIVVPRSEGQTSVTIEIVAKTRVQVEAARKRVLETVAALTPALFDVIQVEPLLHRHIVGRKGQNINRLRETYGVEVIVPDAHSDSHEIVLVYESANSSDLADSAKIRAALESVKQQVDKLASDYADFATKTLTVPARLHRNIIGPKGSTLIAIMGLEPTTSVRLGLPRDGTADAVKASGVPTLTEDSIVIKGPKEEVERVAKEILTLVEETQSQQVTNAYSASFDIPATASPHVIGKGGANINKLTEQFQVKFDLNDRAASDEKTKKKSSNETMEVTIQGVKKNVEAAKETILKMVEQIADATVAKLNIPVEHHSALIGAKGHYVRRLEEKYGVRIQFPKAGELEDEDKSKLNVVMVSGGKKGVQGAKEELLELLDYEKENNNTLEMVVEPKVLPHIVGRSGAKINEIQEASQTRIDIRRSSETDEKKEVRLVISGSKAGLKQALKAIQDIVEAQKSQVEEVVHIDNKYHKVLIGQGGSTLREIIAKAGGPSEMSAQASLVKFQNNNNAVLLRGDKTVVDKIKSEMLTMVAEQENWTTLTISIPAAQHRQVIGSQFSNVKEIENNHNVRIQFPNNKNKKEGAADTSAEAIAANDKVTIKGLRENCEKAKIDLEAKIRSSASRSFSIPKRYRQAVFGDGVWKIRNEFHVSVVLPRGEGGRGGGKRIDVDDENVTHGITDGLSWELHDLSGTNEEEEDAQYTVQLQGTEAACAAVEQHLTGLLNKARASTHVLKIRVPTTYHGLIIGSGGNNIKNIEAESGTSTKIARGEELISITGPKEGVEKAKQAIIRVVSTSDKRA